MGVSNLKMFLEKEYKELEKDSQKVYKYSKIIIDESHRNKNRYRDINPMHYNMVTLDDMSYNGPNYFNGNYILNSHGNVDFIATQGPLEGTSEEFWEVVMRNDVQMIVGMIVINFHF
jgi:protein tyrosine phosphatase